ncbi:hypothetical protein [Streptomyces sp. LUP47B]|uniref:hypothetical protein n=1 Tax=Streptomyces sp. LUP47B TaxID=1890286 RepID=UPI00085161D6|nr:hypothetical protein [Streptomyces sp. LUP47B]
MEAELAALATSGATTLIGLMVSDTWTQARDRLVRIFARAGDEDAAEEELRASQRELMAARNAADDAVVADIEAGWRIRLRRALEADPDAAEELRSMLAELSPAAGEAVSQTVRNSISGGVQHGPVLQGQSFSGLTFNGSGSDQGYRTSDRHDGHMS